MYHSLFDEALERFNAKQTRSDRRIDDYYEKIRSGKQEKPFHEIILQIGNCDDTGATTEAGEQARAALDEYYKGFAERNPNLRVFSAHLHMDEATPHLHIDLSPSLPAASVVWIPCFSETGSCCAGVQGRFQKGNGMESMGAGRKRAAGSSHGTVRI